MEVKFIPAKYTKPIKLPEKLIDLLPKKLCLYTTVQFIDQLPKIIEQLEKSGKEIVLHENTNYYYNKKKTQKGQLLGCSLEKVEDSEAFLYIGDGLFHPSILMVKNTQPVYSYDPIGDIFKKLPKEDVEKIKKKQKAALSVFLMKKEVGVIISTKPGQSLLKRALELKKKYPEKNFYFVVFNDINFNELENFSFVECWVNTACYRIGYDDGFKTEKPIVNIDDLEE